MKKVSAAVMLGWFLVLGLLCPGKNRVYGRGQSFEGDGLPGVNAGVTDIPCYFIRGHIYVKGRLAGVERLWIIDTGAEISFIDSAFARELNLESKGAIDIRGAYHLCTFPLVTVTDLSIASMNIASIRAVSTDLAGMFMTDRHPLPVGGVLGKDFLANVVTRIDYAERKVAFFVPHTFQYAGDGTILEAEADSGLLTVPVTVNGRYRGRWFVDVGADGSSFHYDYAKSNGFLSRKGLRYTARGLGGQARGCISQFDKLQIGAYTLRTPILSFPLEEPVGAFNDHRYAGNLGNSVLRHFVVYIDYLTPRVILEKGKHFDQGFPLRLKGGMDVLIAADGGLLVHDLAPNARWKKVGLCKGDRLDNIQGTPLNGIEGVGRLLKKKPTVSCLTILRSGETLDIMCDFAPNK